MDGGELEKGFSGRKRVEMARAVGSASRPYQIPETYGHR